MRRIWHWRSYPIDETCKLYLPFYKYGGEQTKIWDISTSHNDGTITGAVPGTYPIIATPELMPNQVDRDFSGASAWTNVDLNAYNETTDLTITANTVAQYCTCPVASIPTTIGKRYRLYYDLANIVQTWTVKSFDGTQTIGTISANATQGYLDFTASTTGGLRLVAVANTSSGDFDNFSLKEITHYTGPGWYFDGVDDKITITDFLEVGNSGKELTALLWQNNVGLVDSVYPFAHWDSNTNRRGWMFSFEAGNKFGIYVSDDGTFDAGHYKQYVSSLTGWNTNFNQIGFTFNAGTLSLYANGVLDTSPTKTNDDTITTISNSSANLTIGCYLNNGAWTSGPKCLVGEALIFNRVLSAQEIRNHYELTRSIYGV